MTGRGRGGSTRAVAAVATLVTATFGAMGASTAQAAQGPSKAIEAQADDHASGLSVDRRWTLTDGRRPRLRATITLQNRTAERITTELVEPVPTTSAKRVTFDKGSTPTASRDGLARYPVRLAPDASTTIGYEALLTRSATPPDDRLAAAIDELELASAGLDATPEDVATAAYARDYRGSATIGAETTSSGLNLSQPLLGTTQERSVKLAPLASACRVPARACAFQVLTDGPGRDAQVTPENTLSASWTEDVTNVRPISCPDGSGVVPASVDYRTSLRPATVGMSWGGWLVSAVAYEGQFVVRTDPLGRCPATFVDRVESGTLTATTD